MTTIIENHNLRVAINPQGAELDSIRHKQTKLEYLWQGDAAFWGKKSPVLFLAALMAVKTILFFLPAYHGRSGVKLIYLLCHWHLL